MRGRRDGDVFRSLVHAEDRSRRIKVVPAEERSNWSRKIVRGEFVTLVEVLPPKGVDAEKTLDSIRLLKDAGVDGVNIPDGARAQSRMSALATAVLVEQKIGIESVLHYCCRDRNLLGMMSDLLGASALGIRNLLLITGDPPKMGPYPDATAVFDIDAIGLTNMVNKLNHGSTSAQSISQPTHSIGVGVNRGTNRGRDPSVRVQGRSGRAVCDNAARI